MKLAVDNNHRHWINEWMKVLFVQKKGRERANEWKFEIIVQKHLTHTQQQQQLCEYLCLAFIKTNSCIWIYNCWLLNPPNNSNRTDRDDILSPVPFRWSHLIGRTHRDTNTHIQIFYAYISRPNRRVMAVLKISICDTRTKQTNAFVRNECNPLSVFFSLHFIKLYFPALHNCKEKNHHSTRRIYDYYLFVT